TMRVSASASATSEESYKSTAERSGSIARPGKGRPFTSPWHGAPVQLLLVPTLFEHSRTARAYPVRNRFKLDLPPVWGHAPGRRCAQAEQQKLPSSLSSLDLDELSPSVQ